MLKGAPPPLSQGKVIWHNPFSLHVSGGAEPLLLRYTAKRWKRRVEMLARSRYNKMCPVQSLLTPCSGLGCEFWEVPLLLRHTEKSPLCFESAVLVTARESMPEERGTGIVLYAQIGRAYSTIRK